MNSLQNLVDYGKVLLEKGYVAGPGGNISLRVDGVAYMSPSGFALDAVEVEDYVRVEIATGKLIDTRLKPTSETSFHLAIYRTRQDVNAIIHAHPPFASGLVSAGGKLQPMTPDYVAYLDHVEAVPYIVPTSQELADAIAEAVRDCNCLTLVNHGTITVGANLKEAYYRTDILEQSAKMQVIATLVGEPKVFTDAQVEEVRQLRAEAYRRKMLREGKV